MGVNSLQIYLQDVLGIQSFLPTIVEAPVVEILEPESHRSVYFLDEKKWSAEENDLFQKMRAAMKLSEADVKIVFLEASEVLEREIEFLSADYIVSFSPEITKGLVHTHDQVASLTTISPRLLLKNPSQKKQAWEDLKTVMSHLGLH